MFIFLHFHGLDIDMISESIFPLNIKKKKKGKTSFLSLSFDSSFHLFPKLQNVTLLVRKS